jgi:nitroreductase
MTCLRPIDRILDLARWAPSGDNTQPWRFEVVNDQRVVVHGTDTRDHCVYDLDGRPSQIALGALIETAAIAASAHGWAMHALRREGLPESQPTFELRFEPDADVRPSELIDAIPRRSVQRRMMSTRSLSTAQKSALESTVGPDFHVRWVDGWSGRGRVAALLFRSARLRLTMPEAYRVHRDVIEWNARYSIDRVPDQALGASKPTLRLMRFAMASWERVAFFNRFLAGTWIPRIELDLLPGLACAGHFVLLPTTAPTDIDDYVHVGRAMQRFWLTASHLGLVLQPEITPLVFSRYARTGTMFSATPGMAEGARRVAYDLARLLGDADAAKAAFMGRVGVGPQPIARSLRKGLPALRTVTNRDIDA